MMHIFRYQRPAKIIKKASIQSLNKHNRPERLMSTNTDRNLLNKLVFHDF